MKHILLAILLATSLVGCKRKKIPEWHGKIYVGYSDSSGIYMARTQDGEYIAVESDTFLGTVIFTPKDFESFFETYVNGCRTWKRGVPRNFKTMSKLIQLKADSIRARRNK